MSDVEVIDEIRGHGFKWEGKFYRIGEIIKDFPEKFISHFEGFIRKVKKVKKIKEVREDESD